MSSKSRHLRKQFDMTVRALTQIEAIANAALEKNRGDTDLHWIVDGIADLAHYAVEVASDPPTRDGVADTDLVAEESVFPVAGDLAEDGDPPDGTRRNH